MFLSYFFTTTRLEENLQALGLIALLGMVVFFARLGSSPWTWGTIAFCLLGGILLRPTEVPNHHIMLFYSSLALAVCFSASAESHQALIQHNFRWIVVALMGIATVQRLFQPSFMSGDYLGMEIALGGFIWPLLKFLPGISETIVANREAVEVFRQAPPAETSHIILESPFPVLPWLAKIFMVSILGIEAVVCILMWRCPRHIMTHLAIMTFGLTLAVLRQELTFIAVLCMLGQMVVSHTDRVREGYMEAASVNA